MLLSLTLGNGCPATTRSDKGQTCHHVQRAAPYVDRGRGRDGQGRPKSSNPGILSPLQGGVQKVCKIGTRG